MYVAYACEKPWYVIGRSHLIWVQYLRTSDKNHIVLLDTLHVLYEDGIAISNQTLHVWRLWTAISIKVCTCGDYGMSYVDSTMRCYLLHV